jgi:(2Fe-2S) ferredoxin
MPKFERHLFVCINERTDGHPRGCCGHKDAGRIRELLKSGLKRRGLKGRIRANKSGCLDQCEHGPTIVVYPDNVWYGFVKPEDVEDIIESHLVRGQPVERLMLGEGCLNTASCPHKARPTIQLGGLGS